MFQDSVCSICNTADGGETINNYPRKETVPIYITSHAGTRAHVKKIAQGLARDGLGWKDEDVRPRTAEAAAPLTRKWTDDDNQGRSSFPRT